MTNTRQFTIEDQQILKNFTESNEIYKLVNDIIYNTEKCKRWLNENPKIKSALDKNLNIKKDVVEIQDKFLWVLSDIINFQLEEHSNHIYKKLIDLPKLKDFFIFMGLYVEVKGITASVNISSENNDEKLVKNIQEFLSGYNPKTLFHLDRLNSVIKKVDEKYKEPFIIFDEKAEKNSNDTSSKFNFDEKTEQNILQVGQEEDILSKEQFSLKFNKLLQYAEKHLSKKRKYEEDSNDISSTKKIAKYDETLQLDFKCIGETIPNSDSE